MENKVNLSGVNGGTVARTAMLMLALTNQILTVYGKPIIPVDDEELGTLISLGFTVTASMMAWWKNNSITKHAQNADTYLSALKGNNVAKEPVYYDIQRT